jgi:Holliday junction resolvase RusA-like endonuclease
LAWTAEIILHGQPAGKGRPRFSGRNGVVRTFTDGKTRSYEAALRVAGGHVMGDRLPLEGPLEVGIFAFFEVPKSWSQKKRNAALKGDLLPTKKPDGDNLAKMVDALNNVCWCDDSQITDWTIQKRYSEKPRLEVKVRPAWLA